jgi:hypothetical protein
MTSAWLCAGAAGADAAEGLEVVVSARLLVEELHPLTATRAASAATPIVNVGLFGTKCPFADRRPRRTTRTADYDHFLDRCAQLVI